MLCKLTELAINVNKFHSFAKPDRSVQIRSKEFSLNLRKMERAIEFLIKWFLLLVFAGWVMYWMVLPTKISRKEWSPELTEFTNTTYFGRLGIYSKFFFFFHYLLIIDPNIPTCSINLREEHFRVWCSSFRDGGFRLYLSIPATKTNQQGSGAEGQKRE